MSRKDRGSHGGEHSSNNGGNIRDAPIECKVYVGDLPKDATEREVEEAFAYFGKLKNVWVARNPPGFAFVEFEDSRDAQDAVKELDGTKICGVRARVEHSSGKIRPKPWLRDNRGGGSRHRYDRGGGGGMNRYNDRNRRDHKHGDRRSYDRRNRSKSRSRSYDRNDSGRRGYSRSPSREKERSTEKTDWRNYNDDSHEEKSKADFSPEMEERNID